MVAPREFRTLAKRNGKVFMKGSLELSKDGKSLTDSWWNPDRVDERARLVYESE